MDDIDDTVEIFEEMLEDYGEQMFETGAVQIGVNVSLSEYYNACIEAKQLKIKILELVYEYMPKQYTRRKQNV